MSLFANLHCDGVFESPKVTAEARTSNGTTYVNIDIDTAGDHFVVFTGRAEVALDIAVAFLQLYANLSDKDVVAFHAETDPDDGEVVPEDRIAAIFSR